MCCSCCPVSCRLHITDFLSCKVTKMWKALPQSEKTVFEDRAEELMVKYRADLVCKSTVFGAVPVRPCATLRKPCFAQGLRRVCAGFGNAAQGLRRVCAGLPRVCAGFAQGCAGSHGH